MSSLHDAVSEITDTQDTVAFDAITVEAEESESGPPAAPGSVLAALRARAHDIAAETTIDLEVPWYSGVLWARYQAIPMRQVYRATRNGNISNPLIEPEVAADALARALVELFGRDENGQLVPLSPDGPTRFDDTLVELLDLAPVDRTARAVVFALFAHSGRAEGIILRHFADFYTWLSGEEGDQVSEVAEMTVGESRGR